MTNIITGESCIDKVKELISQGDTVERILARLQPVVFGGAAAANLAHSQAHQCPDALEAAYGRPRSNISGQKQCH